MTRALGKVRPKAVRVTNDGVITGIKEAVSDTIKEVTNFLVLAPRRNIMSQIFRMNIEKDPLVVQSKVAVNIFRPYEIKGFTLVSQGGYLFLLALGSKEDDVIPKEGQQNCTVSLVSIFESLGLLCVFPHCRLSQHLEELFPQNGVCSFGLIRPSGTRFFQDIYCLSLLSMVSLLNYGRYHNELTIKSDVFTRRIGCAHRRDQF